MPQTPETHDETMPLEITDDLVSVKSIISEIVKALSAGRKSRERSLVITKLEEAGMWATEGLIKE